jgi:hypothetical protein
LTQAGHCGKRTGWCVASSKFAVIFFAEDFSSVVFWSAPDSVSSDAQNFRALFGLSGF